MHDWLRSAILVLLSFFRDNWIKSGFGPEYKEYSATEPYVFDMRSPVEVNRSAIDYAVENANYICDNYPHPINVMLSGGADSQAMVDAFLRTGRDDFIIVTYQYPDGLNDYDTDWANRHAEALGYSIDYRDFDIVAFHESNELAAMAHRFINHSPHILSHLKMISMTEGTCVLAGNPIGLDSQQGIVDLPNYTLSGTKRYSEISGQPVVGLFFLYSPEITYSMYRLRPKADDLHHGAKMMRYQMGGFRILPTPAKYHGFEALKERYDGAIDRVSPAKARYYGVKYGSNRAYDHLFRHPLMEAVPYREMASAMLTPR